MYKDLDNLIMYRELGSDCILRNLADAFRAFDEKSCSMQELTGRIYREIRRLLSLGTDFGFDKNLWHDYIAYILVTNENPFTLTAECTELEEGSVRNFILSDIKIFIRLFCYDFSVIEKELQLDCFSTISNYKAIQKRATLYNKDVSEKVRGLSDSINRIIFETDKAGLDDETTAEAVLEVLTDFYRKHGVGALGLNSAFRVCENDEFDNPSAPENVPSTANSSADSMVLPGGVRLTSIRNNSEIRLDDLIGYDIQKKRLRENTEAFLAGSPANNVLLFGDAGTGKSTSIKALINEYENRGLRMIELYKHQMKKLSTVISGLKNRNYKFIIYMDDLSFEENETEYKYLKAVIEGGLETRPDNVLIYATSNRRNLIKETWNDTNDVELDKHRSDTLQEKLSLVSRFGVTIPYMRPNKKEYEAIVSELAERAGIVADSDEGQTGFSKEKLLEEAGKWSVGHGGMSGRAAQQLIDSLT